MIFGVAVDEGHERCRGFCINTADGVLAAALVKRALSRPWRSRTAEAQPRRHDSSIHSREPHGCSRDKINYI